MKTISLSLLFRCFLSASQVSSYALVALVRTSA